MNHLDCFSGIGGFAYAAQQVWGVDYNNIGFIEINKYCQALLKLRFKGANIYGDIKEVTAERIIADSGIKESDGLSGEQRKEISRAGAGVDLFTGGFPCQPFSSAGKQRGKEDDRWLWPEMFRLICEIRPRWVIGENVAGIVKMALDEVLADLESEGYSCETFIIPACGVNAPHKRNRVWIVANRQGRRQNSERKSEEQIGNGDSNVADPDRDRLQEPGTKQQAGGDRQFPEVVADLSDIKGRTEQEIEPCRQTRFEAGKYWDSGAGMWERSWLEVATELCGVDARLPAELDGLKLSKSGHRIQRLIALGNAIVPQVVMEIMYAIKEVEAGEFQ